MTAEQSGSRYVFIESNQNFGREVTFHEAFPEISEIKVRVTESIECNFGDMIIKEFSKETLLGYINCSNPDCVDGGFSIGRVVREMVQNKDTHKVYLALCRGNIGTRKRWINKKDCCHHFTATIDITY